MSGTTVLVIQVVGVLPNVEGEDGLEAVGHGVIGVGVLGDGQFSFLIGLQPVVLHVYVIADNPCPSLNQSPSR